MHELTSALDADEAEKVMKIAEEMAVFSSDRNKKCSASKEIRG